MIFMMGNVSAAQETQVAQVRAILHRTPILIVALCSGVYLTARNTTLKSELMFLNPAFCSAALNEAAKAGLFE
jgi:hypothetical protein